MYHARFARYPFPLFSYKRTEKYWIRKTVRSDSKKQAGESVSPTCLVVLVHIAVAMCESEFNN